MRVVKNATVDRPDDDAAGCSYQSMYGLVPSIWLEIRDRRWSSCRRLVVCWGVKGLDGLWSILV